MNDQRGTPSTFPTAETLRLRAAAQEAEARIHAGVASDLRRWGVCDDADEARAYAITLRVRALLNGALAAAHAQAGDERATD